MGTKKKRCFKALVVKAEQTLQKVGTLQICAPLGVQIDSKTGELITPVELKLLGKPVFTPTVVPCKLINHGLQKACLIVEQPRNSGCGYGIVAKLNLDVPIFAMHEIPGLQPGDAVQEKAEVESIDIRGIRNPSSPECGDTDLLIIKIVYKVEVCITREETVCLPEHGHKKDDEYCIQEGDSEDTIINKNDIKIIVNPFQKGKR